MIDSRYLYVVEVHRGNELLGRLEASVAPCIEDTLFRSVTGGTAANDGSGPDCTIVPTWADSGPPFVCGLQVISAGGREIVCYDRRVFRPRMEAIVRDLSRAKRVRQGEYVQWRVIASERPAARTPRFRSRATRAPYPFRRGHLPGAPPGSFTVTVSPALLDAITEAVSEPPAIEHAGLLWGYLTYDPTPPAAALHLNGQTHVGAGPNGASSRHFAFGARSFLEAKQAHGTSSDGAVLAGWYHSHPACRSCDAQQTCRADTVFFSADDAEVHASAFPAAYMVALVAGKIAAEPGFRLYGWQAGGFAELPFAVITNGAEVSPRPEARYRPDTNPTLTSTPPPASEGAAANGCPEKENLSTCRT